MKNVKKILNNIKSKYIYIMINSNCHMQWYHYPLPYYYYYILLEGKPDGANKLMKELIKDIKNIKKRLDDIKGKYDKFQLLYM